MKPYRIKHIPTGLYYQPVKSGNSLGERGKVYLTNASPLSMNGDDYLKVAFSDAYLAIKKALLTNKPFVEIEL